MQSETQISARKLIFFTASLAFLSVFSLFTWRRTVTSQVQNPEVFWNQKFFAPSQFDIVVAGDSRAYRGVSPQHMNVGELKVLNFGFDGVGLCDNYLKVSGEKLAQESNVKAILIVLTPYSLTPNACKWNEFVSLKKSAIPLTQSALMEAQVSHFIRRVTSQDIKEMLGKPASFREEYFAEGWVASQRVKVDPAEADSLYIANFKNNQVDGVLVENLVDWIKVARESGVRVFVTRSPTAPSLKEIENTYGNFNEENARSLIVSKGGEWLDLEPSILAQLQFYDGSHLDRSSAEIWSKSLGKSLCSQIENANC